MTALKSEIAGKISGRILDHESGYAHLKELVRHFRLEKPLLNLTNYEHAEFFPLNRKTMLLQEPDLEQISLVFPVSFHFCLYLRLDGHFKVKYNHISIPLPKSIDPFPVRYSGIVTPQDDKMEYKNEKLELA